MMRKRCTIIGVLVLVVSLVFPGRVAFGLDIWPDGSFWSGVTYSGTYGSFIRASNKYDAAVYAIGEDPNRLSDEVKAKLSDPNYGGNFYSYASEFYNVTSFDSIPGFVPTYVVFTLTGIFHTWERVFAAETTIALRDAALVDFRRILGGEDLSGGGSGGNPDSPDPSIPTTLTFNHDNYVGPARFDGWFTNTSYTSKVDLLVGGTIDISSIRSRISSYVSSYPYVTYLIENSNYSGFYNGCNVSLTLRVFFSSSEPTVSAGNTITFPSGYRSANSVSLSPRVTQNSDSLELVASGAVFNVSSPNSSSYAQTLSSKPFYVLGNYMSSTPSPPSGDWPTPTPTPTPTAPEIPTPTAPTIPVDPTVTDPTVTWPDINITVEPAPVVVTETPSGLDYTDLLTRINDNLISLDAYTKAINSDLNSLRADLLTGFDGLVQGLRNIYQYLQHLDDLLERHCKHIRDSIDENVYELELYLKGLFEWLPEQLSFDASFDYDDSGVIGWLKKIYLKLGGGTSAPNPVADPGGFFSWLLGLIMGFLASLLAGLPDKVQELLTDLSDLTGYFPFSAPWDLYALLALFAHDPVTPVISIPWGLGSDNTVNVVVDCTPWNGVMSIVREVEKVIFAGGLAWFTFELFKPTDVLGD